jgi:intracellular sulfur oxidation DsrE/DsrF family protein
MKSVAVVLMLLMAIVAVVNETMTGKVVVVADGDTITILTSENKHERVR